MEGMEGGGGEKGVDNGKGWNETGKKHSIRVTLI